MVKDLNDFDAVFRAAVKDSAADEEHLEVLAFCGVHPETELRPEPGQDPAQVEAGMKLRVACTEAGCDVKAVLCIRAATQEEAR